MLKRSAKMDCPKRLITASLLSFLPLPGLTSRAKCARASNAASPASPPSPFSSRSSPDTARHRNPNLRPLPHLPGARIRILGRQLDSMFFLRPKQRTVQLVWALAGGAFLPSCGEWSGVCGSSLPRLDGLVGRSSFPSFLSFSLSVSVLLCPTNRSSSCSCSCSCLFSCSSSLFTSAESVAAAETAETAAASLKSPAIRSAGMTALPPSLGRTA
jgi:hypothetical protein